METLEFSDGLMLTRYEMPKTGKPELPGLKHNIWIYDRSGSMYQLIRDVIRDLEHFADGLVDGDTLSIAWFSTEGGTYRFILKGHVIGRGTDDIVKRMLRENNTVIGLTCFSEVLKETESVVQDLKAMGITDSFALMFFTDGYPVVRNYQREINDVFQSIQRLAPVITDAMMVGYGDYYNRDLLADMARTFGGSLVHSSRIEEWEEYMGDFLGGALGVPRMEIQMLAKGVVDVFTISGKTVTRYDMIKDGNTVTVRVPSSADEVYVLHTEKV